MGGLRRRRRSVSRRPPPPRPLSMGFACDWLESAYQKWRLSYVKKHIPQLICVILAVESGRAIARVPQVSSLGPLSVFVAAVCLHLFGYCRPGAVNAHRIGVVLLLIAECISAGLDSLLPIVVSIFVVYSLLSFTLPFVAPLVAGVFTILHIFGFMLLGNGALHQNEVLAGLLVHTWAHLVGIYLNIQHERICRSGFLSARNASDAETSTQQQSHRLNRLLSSFLPSHLVTNARHQLAMGNPHIYVENYNQVTVAYARLIGFESALSQCSSLDAARVLKELDLRIDSLAASHGCTRIASEGITVVCPIPAVDSEHATKICRFALDLEALICSFQDATAADVAVCVGIDSGSVSCGVVGTSKWHYDVVGNPMDNAVLLQSRAPSHGVFVTDETRRFLDISMDVDPVGEFWRIRPEARCGTTAFPVNKRYSLVTIPQAINRLLQTISADDQTIKNKKRKVNEEERTVQKLADGKSFMNCVSLIFKNKKLEEKFHEEMDHWFIPGLAMSIVFLVIYAAYHILVMPRLVASIILLVMALVVMFGLVLVLYVEYFQSFSQFITRTSSGHTITILILLLILLLNGIVNTFSCPPEPSLTECRLVSFSTISFALWFLTSAVFLRFPSSHLMGLHFLVLVVYCLQVLLNHPTISETEFVEEFDLLFFLVGFSIYISLFSRYIERQLRVDFLSVVKGVEETSSKESLIHLNSQALLNIVPIHVAPMVANRGAELWHHAHHSVGIAYLAVSGFELVGEQGLNGLNFVFSYFDQTVGAHKGLEKVKSANRFYVVAVGTMPETSHDVNEAPWTIGELLHNLAKFLLNVTEFAKEKEFEVQIGLDCGSALAFVSDADHPHYEMWGEAVERARILMQSASQGRILVSEEAYLSLRPRQLNFLHQPVKIISDLNAYVLHSGELEEDESLMETAQESVNQVFEPDQMMASMTSSYSSELQSINGGETDSDIEWITPETALMQQRMAVRPVRKTYRDTSYDPYRQPTRPYKGEHSVQYSDWSEHENSRAPSRGNDRRGKRWGRSSRASSKASLRNAFGWLKKGTSMDVDSLADPAERLEAAANRVDRMLAELENYGNFAEVKPLEYKPFPTAFGSVKSIHRAMSSACHTEYDNAESEAALSDAEYAQIRHSASRNRRQRRRRWRPDDADADTESQCSSTADMELGDLRWKSVHSVGYENEYEVASDCEGLAVEQMLALSRDIRKNFGDFQLATFEDIDRD